ncbi:hypothetical protein EC23916_2020 [Escherichia coli 2.3916]|nr:hypothetical protein EC23916_2020 [Escherichia coli 2.3916]
MIIGLPIHVVNRFVDFFKKNPLVEWAGMLNNYRLCETV